MEPPVQPDTVSMLSVWALGQSSPSMTRGLRSEGISVVPPLNEYRVLLDGQP